MTNPNQAPTPEQVTRVELPPDQFIRIIKSAHHIIDLSGLRTEIYPAGLEKASEKILSPDLVSTTEPIGIAPGLVGEEWYDNIRPLFTPEGVELSDKRVVGVIFLGNCTVAASYFLWPDGTIQATRQFRDGRWTGRYAPKPETTEGLINTMESTEQQLVERRVGHIVLAA